MTSPPKNPADGAEEDPQVEPARTVHKRLVPSSWVSLLLAVIGVVTILYVARPVLLPLFLAVIAGMTLKPLIRWFSSWHIPAALSAAGVLLFLAGVLGFGFFQLGHPALGWMNDAPQHLSELRHRVQKRFPHISRIDQAADAVNDLGASEQEKKAEQKKSPTVEVRDARGAGTLLNWTGGFTS